MTRRDTTVSALAVALALAGCGKKSSSTPTTATDAIHIGAILTISGTLASASALEQEGIELARDEINAAGGVLGKQLAIDIVDDAADPDKSLEQTKTLAASTTLMLGPSYSSGLLKTADWAIANNVSLLSYSATSPAISALKDNDLVNRTAPSDAFQGGVAAKVAYGAPHNARKAAIIYLDNAYGQGLSAAFKAAFEKLGGTVLSSQSYPELSDAEVATHNFSDVATAALAGNPDLLYLITYESDGAQLTKALKAGFDAMATKPTVLGCDGNATDGFLANADPDVTANMIGTQPAGDETKDDYKAFAARFKAKYNADAGLYSSLAYDAVYLYALAITKANATDGKTVAPEIKAVSRGATKVKPTDYATAVTDIKAGTDVGYVGVSGLAGLDDNGDPTNGTYEVWKNVSKSATQDSIVPYP